MASTDGTWKGVTRPVNEHLPTAAELAANDALIEELKGQNNFESAEDTDKRFESFMILL
jgi:poly(A) polymerase